MREGREERNQREGLKEGQETGQETALRDKKDIEKQHAVNGCKEGKELKKGRKYHKDPRKVKQ